MESLEFDVVIIGAGPSAAGLLRGILLRILDHRQRRRSSNDDHILLHEDGDGSEGKHNEHVDWGGNGGEKDMVNNNSDSNKSPLNSSLSDIRIAILERGTYGTPIINSNVSCHGTNNSNGEDEPGNARVSNKKTCIHLNERENKRDNSNNTQAAIHCSKQCKNQNQNQGVTVQLHHHKDQAQHQSKRSHAKKQPQPHCFNHRHPTTFLLQNWFSAAHYTSKPTPYIIEHPIVNIGISSPSNSSNFKPSKGQPHTDPYSTSLLHTNNQTTNKIYNSTPTNSNINNTTDTIPSSPTILHESQPQPHLHNRILDIPTGSGYGGTTNIHAGLVVEPDYENDFISWPKRWRQSDGTSKGEYNTVENEETTTCTMKEAVNEIVNALRENNSLTCWSKLRGAPMAGKVPFWQSHLNTCSGGKSVIDVEHSDNWINDFHEVITTSSNVDVDDNDVMRRNSHTNGKKDHAFTMPTAKRVNYFSALVEPLLRNHPELENNLTFFSGVQVERILVGCDCSFSRSRDHGGRDEERSCDDSDGNSHDTASDGYGKHPHPWAVECFDTQSNNQILIRSKQEVILCAGAIGSPSLLLASGIGHEDDLRKAGIIPWYEQHSCPNHCQSNGYCIYRDLPVGHNLRDHILLPRSFLTHCQSKVATSCNSIHGWWMLNLPWHNEECSNIQLQLADGNQMDSMIPHFAAAVFRRRWRLSLLCNYEVPAMWISYIFYPIRYIIKALITATDWSKEWVRLHTASINICLLNPLSVGKVAIISNRTKASHHYPRSTTLPAQMATSSMPTRLSDCQVMIDPGYLSNPRDIEALWAGWNASTRIKHHWHTSCIEVLPGYFFLIGFSIASTIKSIFHGFLYYFLLAKAFGVEKKNTNTGSNIMPSKWFSSYAAEFVVPYYHWCGSCIMGEETSTDNNKHNSNASHRGDLNSNKFVVNEQLCVRGIARLRVCDASVIPTCISGPTALTCAALGHVASEICVRSLLDK